MTNFEPQITCTLYEEFLVKINAKIDLIDSFLKLILVIALTGSFFLGALHILNQVIVIWVSDFNKGICGIWNGFTEGIRGIWNGFTEGIRGIWNGFTEGIRGIWNGASEGTKGIFMAAEDFSTSLKAASGEVWRHATHDNISRLVVAGVLLLVFPSLGSIINKLIGKVLPLWLGKLD